VSVEDIKTALRNLKMGLAAGADCVVSEHIIHSHHPLLFTLSFCFYMMLLHGYVPHNFCKGIIVPSVRDKYGDLSSVENYHPITLSSVTSKIFESLLLLKYGKYFSVNDRQFGLRKKSSCNSTIFVLCNMIEYFNIFQ